MLIVGRWDFSAFVLFFWVAAGSEICFFFLDIFFITCEILNNLHYALLDFVVSQLVTNLDLNKNVCFQYFGPILMVGSLIWKKVTQITL